MQYGGRHLLRVTALVATLPAMLLTQACGGSAESLCELAQEKLGDCRAEVEHAGTVGAILVPLEITDDCTVQNRCVAECVMPASCGAISYVVRGGSTDPNEPPPAGAETFQGCLYSCL